MGPRHEWFKLDEDDLYAFQYWAETIGDEIISLEGCWSVPEWIQAYAIKTND